MRKVAGRHLSANQLRMPTAGSDGGTSVDWSVKRNDRVAFLDALKATGIVMVVAVHALSRVELDTPAANVIAFLTGAVAVPLFFVADGFLLSWKWTEAPQFQYKAFVRKSAMRLLVPWAAFTTFYTVLRVILERYELTRDTILLGKSFLGVAQVIYLSGVSPHMYFLLSLFLIRLGSAGFYNMLRLPLWAWIAGSALYVSLYQISHLKDWFLPGADPVLLACWGGQFYVLGIVLQKGQLFVRTHTMPLFIIGAGLTIGLRFLIIPANLGIIVQISYLVAIYTAIMFVADRTDWSFSMGKDTMGIYVLHAPLALWFVTEIVLRFLPPGQMVSFAIATCLTVLVSWYAARVMSKRRLGRLLLGAPLQVRSEFRSVN